MFEERYLVGPLQDDIGYAEPRLHVALFDPGSGNKVSRLVDLRGAAPEGLHG